MKHLLLLLCCPFFLKAQFLKSHLIYFSTGSSALTAGHKKQIDSVIATLNNIPAAFYIEVKGHTDNAGSKELNIGLSKNRAQHVTDYLKQKDFRTLPTSVSCYDYTQPIAENTPDLMWKNRRVEIRFYLRRIDMAKSLGVKDAVAQKFRFNEDAGGTLSYDSTTIRIPANSFIFKDGREVQGLIDITYQEYRTPAGFILSGIPMSVKQGEEVQHFNSGGMFTIKAFQNGEELLLKKEADKTVSIDFPLSNKEEQNFYQFDSAHQTWNDAIGAITDAHGNLLRQFSSTAPLARGSIGNTVNSPDYRNYLQCSDNNPCGKADYAIKKLKYLVTHEEPIREAQAYKFICNADVDFKSPWYKLLVDTSARKFTINPVNKNSMLGSFSNYEWSYEDGKTGRDLQRKFRNGCSFVKIVHKNKQAFSIEIDNYSFHVSGKPENAGSESRINRMNRRNTRSYVKYTHRIDRQLDKTEQSFFKRTGMKEEDLRLYYHDSLSCINYFYKALMVTAADTVMLDMDEFNLHKDLLKKKLDKLPSPLSCEDIKKLVRRKDSIDAAYWRRMDSISRVVSHRQDSFRIVRKEAFAKFGINAAGSYNADAVKQINAPVEIYASYENITGRKLKIISVYLNVAGLNGIINYNGIYGYGPYHFVYGQGDKTMLIAVDDQENSYYCSPEEFAAAVTGATDKKVVFEMKSLKDLSTTAKLQQVMLK